MPSTEGITPSTPSCRPPGVVPGVPVSAGEEMNEETEFNPEPNEDRIKLADKAREEFEAMLALISDEHLDAMVNTLEKATLDFARHNILAYALLERNGLDNMGMALGHIIASFQDLGARMINDLDTDEETYDPTWRGRPRSTHREA